MKRITIGGFALTATLALVAYADAKLGFRSAPPPPPVSPPAALPQEVPQVLQQPLEGIEKQSDGISLQFQDFPLGELVSTIEGQTGIEFRLNPSMEAIRVSVDIQAKDWESAVRRLIRTYSRVEVWTARLETSRVWLLDSTPHLQDSPAPPTNNRVRRKPPVRTQQTVQPKLKKPFVARTNNQVAAGQSLGPMMSMLPPHIMNDLGVLKYLQSAGVDLPGHIKRRYGSQLKSLPDNVPISPSALADPSFHSLVNRMKALGLKPPTG